MTRFLRNPNFFFIFSVVILALLIFITPSVSLDNLGDGLLQIIPAIGLGILMLFGSIIVFKNFRIMSDDSEPEQEAETAFDRMLADPIATAIYLAANVIGIALIIAAGLS